MKTGFRAGDAMTKTPVSVPGTAPIKKCCELMKKHRVSSLVVIENKKLQGIVTSKNIIDSIADGLDSNTNASELMNKSVTTIAPDTDIFDALLKMGELDARQFPVMNNDRIVGLLTMKDILKIEPMLFDIIASKLDIREEENKPVYRVGKCDVCGREADDLMRLRNQLVCGNCRIL